MADDTPSDTARAPSAWARISVNLEIAGATLLKLAGQIQAQGDLPNEIIRSDARRKVADACEALAEMERLGARRDNLKIVALPRKSEGC